MLRVAAEGGHLRDRADAVGDLPPHAVERDRGGLQGAVLRLRHVRPELRGDAQGGVRGQLPAVDTEPLGVGSGEWDFFLFALQEIYVKLAAAAIRFRLAQIWSDSALVVVI